jgi:YD repeat-containing protein
MSNITAIVQATCAALLLISSNIASAHVHLTRGYDGNERLIKEVGFDGRVQEYHYNAAGHLIPHS